MVLVDTSVWLDVFRDSDGQITDTLNRVTGDEDFVTIAEVRPVRHHWL